MELILLLEINYCFLQNSAYLYIMYILQISGIIIFLTFLRGGIAVKNVVFGKHCKSIHEEYIEKETSILFFNLIKM